MISLKWVGTLISTTLIASAAATSAYAGWTNVTNYNNGDPALREYWKYVPNSLGNNQELVIVLHGGSSNAVDANATSMKST